MSTLRLAIPSRPRLKRPGYLTKPIINGKKRWDPLPSQEFQKMMSLPSLFTSKKRTVGCANSWQKNFGRKTPICVEGWV